MSSAALSTREVGRHAVRQELARAAFDQFRATGFDQVTFADLAGATGVSRSTFLRYFATKEDVVLVVFDAVGDLVVDAIGAGDADESDWVRLRRALDPVLAHLERDTDHLLTAMRLIEETDALCARLRWKQEQWRPGIVARLVGEDAGTRASAFVAEVRVAAALECLWITLAEWCAGDGEADLADLLDRSFAALAPAEPRS